MSIPDFLGWPIDYAVYRIKRDLPDINCVISKYSSPLSKKDEDECILIERIVRQKFDSQSNTLEFTVSGFLRQPKQP